MIALAQEPHRAPALAGNRIDNGQRLVHAFQHRTLLDMHLEVASRFRREFGRGCGVDLELCQCLGNGDAVSVDPRERLGGTPNDGQAAQERPTKANALFFRERNNLEGERLGCVLKCSGGLDGEHNAEDAIERTGIGHGVEVGAD